MKTHCEDHEDYEDSLQTEVQMTNKSVITDNYAFVTFKEKSETKLRLTTK